MPVSIALDSSVVAFQWNPLNPSMIHTGFFFVQGYNVSQALGLIEKNVNPTPENNIIAFCKIIRRGL